MFNIELYTPTYLNEWNAFVATSKNATFLFDRNYMDYHANRFEDYSLMFYLDNTLFALLPANKVSSVLYSHQGLTYGGLILNHKATAEKIQQLFRELNVYLAQKGFQKVIYKPVPHIYHQVPAEEDLYSLFSVCNAQLTERNLSSAIDLRNKLKWSRDRKYGINRCKNNNIHVEESNDFEAFWKVLEENLQKKYNAHPIHKLKEIELLKDRFPEQIKLFTATKNGQVLGGTVLYITPTVVHTQYISANEEGKQLRVIDGIFHHLLTEREWSASYFDFGTSNEEDGHILVEPLIHQKEGFGGRGICYDWYEWEVGGVKE